MTFRKRIAPLIYSRGRTTQRLDHYCYLQEKQWEPLADNIARQRKLLTRTIHYALKNIPYYQTLGLDTADFKEDNIFSDIKKLPFTGKDTLRNNLPHLYRPREELPPISYTSSGTTGEPVEFFQDSHYRDWVQGSKLMFAEWAGRLPGEPLVKIWGVEAGLAIHREMRRRITGWLKNERVLDAFQTKDEDMGRYVKVINKTKPKMILSFVFYIYELARFIKEHNLEIYSPHSIMVTAETLYSNQRKVIEEVFCCPVFNRYGCREAGDIACECEEHQGLHLNLLNHYVEIVDEDGNRCERGQSGEIVVTTLRNFTMPLIRYRMGDIGMLSAESCACGRGMPLLKEVNGRVTDQFINKRGEIIFGGYFVYYIGEVFNNGLIKKYRVIQKDVDHIVMEFVPRTEGMMAAYHKLFNNIREKILLKMGQDTQLEFVAVREIPHTNSGKYRYVISEVKMGNIDITINTK